MSLPVLATERLSMRPLAFRDTGRIVALVGNFQVARNLGVVSHPYTASDAENWLNFATNRESGGERVFAIDDGGGMIGAISLGKPDKTASLGYWLGEPYWGKGYMSEAARAVVAWYFATFDGDEVLSSALTENAGSIKVLLKTGFEDAGPKELFIPSRGETLPARRFRLLRSAFISGRGAA